MKRIAVLETAASFGGGGGRGGGVFGLQTDMAHCNLAINVAASYSGQLQKDKAAQVKICYRQNCRHNTATPQSKAD